jgi:KaiC/GvpD/RAD55 family RecA-like ATPase
MGGRLLRFGIPTLDELLGKPKLQNAEGCALKCGIGLAGGCATDPTGGQKKQIETASVCIIGSDGAGKSVLAMHLASQYRWDVRNECHVRVIYASTDLTYARASISWGNFALNLPEYRIRDPFALNDFAEKWNQRLPPKESEQNRVELVRHLPLVDRFSDKRDNKAVVFLDLASHSAGDDWGYLNRLIATLPTPRSDRPKHLLVLDAVEGFEVFVGDKDSFGQTRDRRSRVAQLLRTCGGKCHLVLLVEEAPEARKMPEEFVADVVVRLGTKEEAHYKRRVVEIEKVRGQTHVRGIHDIVIRSGQGSTTGEQPHADDPWVEHPLDRNSRLENNTLAARSRWNPEIATVGSKQQCQSYIYVFHSLDYLSSEIMGEHEENTDIATAENRVAGFGIEYLDRILSKSSDVEAALNSTARPITDGEHLDAEDDVPAHGGDWYGIRCDDPVALVGDGGTYKSTLGKAFLARAFDPRLNEPGVAILLTTKPINAEGLKRRLEKDHLYPDKQGKETSIDKTRLICRRLEVHYMPPAVLFHIIKQQLFRGQEIYRKEGNWECDEFNRRATGWRVRFVIDNWTTLCETCPEVKDDPLFLPCLLFFLRREASPTIIISNDTYFAENEPHFPGSQRLCNLTSTKILTWRISFFGGHRVAISVTPPAEPIARGSLIQELRALASSRANAGGANAPDTITSHTLSDANVRPYQNRRLAVGPSFELYDGLERRTPSYVPLKVYLYGGAEATAGYVEQVKELSSILVTGEPNEVVVHIESGDKYERLRELSELQGASRFPYTLVMQVDEYWAKSGPKQLRSQARYLFAHTARTRFKRDSDGAWQFDKSGDKTLLLEDPMTLCQPTEFDKLSEQRAIKNAGPEHTKLWTRASLFTPVGYDFDKHLKEFRDRLVKVPYGWDFGFLMCLRSAWRSAARQEETVKYVWDNLCTIDGERAKNTIVPEYGSVVTWRKFAEASSAVSIITNRQRQKKRKTKQATFVPFGFRIAPEIQETLVCLLLEIWASEILTIAAGSGDEDFVIKEVFRRFRHDEDSKYDLGQTMLRYSRELYRAMLILSELIPPQLISENYQVLTTDSTMTVPVAGRYWYSAASAEQVGVNPGDIYVPSGLPGTFSVRGDWFLAVARGSRSYQMADRALDLLTSRRGNVVRLQTGLALPVKSCREEGHVELWTSLWRFNDAGERIDRIFYDELRRIGAHDEYDVGQRRGRKTFYWLWRSRIKNYDRHARVFRRWACHMLRMRDEFVVDGQPLKTYDIHSGNSNDLQVAQKAKWFDDYAKSFRDVLKRASVG